ncbi:MAG: imidazoleglycerol-phosphate dehydratase HisB [Rhodothermales bacterium]|nr:imidazoleglycerol-phosphate dehydratase HisB [Rhodothermales bacterium]
MSDVPPRSATVERETAETRVAVRLHLDGGGYRTATGVGFLDHLLDLFAKHGGFGLEVTCEGDLHVDDHHTVEDVGIALGRALREALGDKAHVERYGHAYVPMDEALARAVIDLAGRYGFHFAARFDRERVGDLSTEMVRHFWDSVAQEARIALHLTVLYGENDHHRIEALFKAAARAFRLAVRRDAANAAVASTKGSL